MPYIKRNMRIVYNAIFDANGDANDLAQNLALQLKEEPSEKRKGCIQYVLTKLIKQHCFLTHYIIEKILMSLFFDLTFTQFASYDSLECCDGALNRLQKECIKRKWLTIEAEKTLRCLIKTFDEYAEKYENAKCIENGDI